MAYFNFQNLIKKYTVSFTLQIPGETGYDSKGDKVTGTPSETVMTGAIIGFTESKTYGSDSVLTAQDKHLFTTAPIANSLHDAHIVFNGNRYKIEEEHLKDNAQWTGVFSYVLRWVSAFG